jgi:hypothetical protein
MEIAISIFIVTVGLLVFRFIASRMPIFYEHPEYKEHGVESGRPGQEPEFDPARHGFGH